MIYRRPSFGKPQFVLSVVAATTGAIFVGAACDDTMVNEPEQVDAAENVPSSTSGTSAGGGFIGSSGSIGGSVSGTSASSGGCVSNSSSGCNLILYDATSDAIENLDTGSDQEAAAADGSGDGSGDGETGDAAPEAGEQ